MKRGKSMRSSNAAHLSFAHLIAMLINLFADPAALAQGLPVCPTPTQNTPLLVNGCMMTLDGVKQFTSLTIINGGVITHTQNSSAAMRLDLRITGDATIDAASAISADGRGHAAGVGQGRGGTSGYPNYFGGGGGYGGAGGNGAEAAAGGGVTYFGTYVETITEGIAMPRELGSGGYGGGTGGGSIKLRVDGTLTLNGRIGADGGTHTDGGGGSGGSVWIIAQTLTGSGRITANGGDGAGATGGYDGGGGGGRIAVETDDDSAFTTFGGSIEAYGGFGFVRGGAGTIFRPSLTPTDMVKGTVICDNGSSTVSGEATEFTASGDAPSQLRAHLLVRNNALVSHAHDVAAGLNLWVRGDVRVDSTGSISADGRGRPAGAGQGRGGTSGYPNYFGGGGGYGGAGGNGAEAAAGGAPYGDFDNPILLGSGGYGGGAGGGRIMLQVDGRITIDSGGRISAELSPLTEAAVLAAWATTDSASAMAIAARSSSRTT